MNAETTNRDPKKDSGLQVVLRPTDGDPLDLLTPGMLGTRPPMVACTDGVWHDVTDPPTPKCRICGRKLSLGATDAGWTTWACSGGDWRNGPWEPWDDQPDRRLADDHYARSQVRKVNQPIKGETLTLAWAGCVLEIAFTWMRERHELHQFASAPLRSALHAERTAEQLKRVGFSPLPSVEDLQTKSIAELRDLMRPFGTIVVLDEHGAEIERLREVPYEGVKGEAER